MSVQVHFGGEHGYPVAVSTVPRGRRRIMVEVEDFEQGVTRTVLLLHHRSHPDIIIVATTRRDGAERVLARRGAGAKAYRLNIVPVVEPREPPSRAPRSAKKVSAKRRPPSTSSPAA